MNRTHRVRLGRAIAAAARPASRARRRRAAAQESAPAARQRRRPDRVRAGHHRRRTITIGSHQPLTGLAAPGYSEIAPAVERVLPVRQRARRHLRPQDRLQVPRTTPTTRPRPSTVVHQLVLQDNVYAIFNGLGTPTHLAVASASSTRSKVPDVFVASGCECWNDPSTLPETFGWQLDYVREGKILGQYIKQHFAGQEDRLLLPERRVRPGRRQGPRLRDPGKSQVVSRQSYDPTNINDRPPGRRAQGGRRPGRRLVLDPGVHRAAQAEHASS